MEPGAYLDAEVREFFALAADAIFINPFAEQRKQLEASLVPKFLPRVLPGVQLLKSLEAPLLARIEQLDAKGCCTMDQFTARDRQLMEYAYLLSIYLKFIPHFDALIKQQLLVGTEPVTVHFARAAIEQLQQRGFTKAESCHYFALFFQLRRAFYFIGQQLVGDSQAMVILRCSLWNSVFSADIRTYERYLKARMDDFSTLLLGPTGTGKEASAAAIGRSGYIEFDPKRDRFSESFTHAFTTVNLSQFPETLIESELFGHRKGAFTGAMENHQGVFELCSSQGALFLDEIGDVTIPVQVKLLRVLENRSFTPVGSHSEQRFKGRIISATNRPLDQLQQESAFRDDLYYRLCSDVIVLPSLRQCCDESDHELERLVEFLLIRILGEPSSELSEMVLKALQRDLPADYAWPGNVRELEQAVRRILLTGSYRGRAAPATNTAEQELTRHFMKGDLTAKALLSQYCRYLYQRFGSYDEVARKTRMDYRTVKKYVLTDYADENDSS